MTAVQTLSQPKAKRLSDKSAPQNFVEIEEPLTPLEKFRRLGREIVEWRNSQGLSEEDELTMEEIVAIVKEARAERYEEEQKQ